MNQNWNKPDENKDNQPQKTGGMPGCSTSLIVLLLVFAFAPLLLSLFGGAVGDQAQFSYSSFRNEVEAGNVAQVTVSGERITGELITPTTETIEDGTTREYSNFVTYFPAFGDDTLFGLLQANNVEVVTEPTQTFTWWSVLLNALPFLLLIAIALFFLRRTQSQGENVFSMGKSRARLYNKNKERTTFNDVAGAESTKRELTEVVDFLKNPKRFENLGGEIPKGVLLVGPPGTGKTLLARAVAGEASVPFFSITGSDFMEMFVGVGASRVRALFEDAKKNSPAIIFIDELDSIGRRRGAGVGGGHDEREQTLNQLLSELDGFEKNVNVIVIAATNRPDILDPALLRPGRFDRRVTVDLPTLKDRMEILEIHSRNKPFSDDVQMEKIARGTPGFSGADLANLLNEAALIAARKYKETIEIEDIHQATDKILLGLERENLVLTEKECRLLAFHEAGHAVVAAVLPNADPVHKVTIVPRGRSMGVTQQLPERDRYLYPRDYMLDRLAVMMGGRVAEEVFLNTMTSGAENDLKQATQLVRKMVLDWGMSKKLGPIALGDDRGEVFLGEDLGHRREYSELTAREVDEEIMAILESAYERAKETLKEHHEGLERLVEALMDHEIVHGEEVLKLLGIERPRKKEKLHQRAEI
jgi:cell division protease FtsH